MSIDINKQQVDIENLKKQNELDLNSIKELYKRIEELGEKITQIKYIDVALARKLKKEYESLKKVIINENVQALLSDKIDNEINKTKTEINNKIKKINSQLVNIDFKKVDKVIARLKSENIDLDDLSSRTLQAIKGGEGTNFNLLNIPRDKSVDYEKTTFFNVEKSLNLFNKESITNVGYILDESNNGVLIENEDGAISDYIPIKYEDNINTNTNWSGCFYDINKNFISAKAFGTTSFAVPSNCYYYRQNINMSVIDTIMICVNNQLPSKYVDYSINVTTTDEFKNIINNSIELEPDSTTFFKSDFLNLFDKTNVTDGYIINDTGGLTEQANGCASDFIEIKENVNLYFSTKWNGAYYDENKKFIKMKEFGTFTEVSPAGSKYIRVSVELTQKDSYMLSYYPIEQYHEYGKQLLFANVKLDMISNQLIETLKFNKNNLKNKTWAAVGDSLTEVNEATTKHYHDYISEETGIKVVNYGIGGTGYMRGYDNNNAFYQRVNNISSNVDVITIFGSGNDLGGNVGIDKLGDINDADTTTICGCINKTFDNLFKKFPSTPIGVISPTPWQNYPTTIPNNNMELYVQKLEEICKLRGVKYLDLYHSSLLRPEDETNRNLCFYNKAELDGNGDGVHPNEIGHKIIYPSFREFLKTLI